MANCLADSVVSTLSSSFGYPLYLLLFGTVVGATVGGNITPIGAAANIVGVGLLKKKTVTKSTSLILLKLVYRLPSLQLRQQLYLSGYSGRDIHPALLA